MATVLDALSWVFLTLGGAFIFIGGVGLVRMPTFYARLHASSLTDSAGTILILAGLVCQVSAGIDAFKLLATLAFLLVTGPTASYALANAALLAGVPTDAQSVDDDDGQGDAVHGQNGGETRIDNLRPNPAEQED